MALPNAVSVSVSVLCVSLPVVTTLEPCGAGLEIARTAGFELSLSSARSRQVTDFGPRLLHLPIQTSTILQTYRLSTSSSVLDTVPLFLSPFLFFPFCFCSFCGDFSSGLTLAFSADFVPRLLIFDY